MMLSVRATNLGAVPSETHRRELVDALVSMLLSGDSSLEAATSLAQFPVPDAQRYSALAAVARALGDPEATIIRAAAMVSWGERGPRAEEALTKLLHVQPRPGERKRVISRDTLLGPALVGAVRYLVPKDPSVVNLISEAARRHNLSWGDATEIDDALRRLGYTGRIWDLGSVAQSDLVRFVTDDWAIGIREWLQEMANGRRSLLARGEVRRLKRLRDCIATLGIANTSPRQVFETVRRGDSRPVLELTCLLADIDEQCLATEAAAFLERHPMQRPDYSGWDRLFDGDDRELTRWERTDSSADLRMRLVSLLGATDIAAYSAAEALLHDPSHQEASAAIIAALSQLKNSRRRLACRVLLEIASEPERIVLQWASDTDTQHRIVAAMYAPPLLLVGRIDPSVVVSLAGDVDDAVRQMLRRAFDKPDIPEDLRRMYGQPTESPPQQWTCYECGVVLDMESLKCPHCGSHGPGVVVNLDVDIGSRLERR